MRILFDHGTPVPLRQFLQATHHVETVFERRWHQLRNGDLLRVSEEAAFDVFVTTDQHLREQQNLAGRKIAIVVLLTTNWTLIGRHTDLVITAISHLTPGAFVEVGFPANRE